MTREEAMKQLQDAKDGYKEYLTDEALDMAIKALKTGHWIRRNSFLVPYKCSECNYESERYDNYCPNCGARMVEPRKTKQPEISSFYGLRSYIRQESEEV